MLKKVNSLLDPIKGNTASRLREEIALPPAALVRYIWNTEFGLSYSVPVKYGPPGETLVKDL